MQLALSIRSFALTLLPKVYQIQFHFHDLINQSNNLNSCIGILLYVSWHKFRFSQKSFLYIFWIVGHILYALFNFSIFFKLT